MKMKRVLSLSLAALMSVAMLSACNANADTSKDDGKKIKIGVAQIVQHESLNTARDAFVARLAELGYKDKENIEIEFRDAQGENSNNKPIIDAFKADKKDLILAIATSTAQEAIKVSDDIPVVFAAITDPVGAKLVDSLESTGKNVTGVSDALVVEKYMENVLKVKPDIKTIGLLYNPGEANSVSTVEEFKVYFKDKGIEVVESGVTNSSEVAQAVQTLVTKKVDAIFTPTDNVIAAAIDTTAKIVLEQKIPFFVGADMMVEKGALMSIGVNYTDIGRDAADMAVAILKGEKQAKDIPVKVYKDDLSIFVNTNTADTLGITIPDEILNSEKTVKFSK